MEEAKLKVQAARRGAVPASQVLLLALIVSLPLKKPPAFHWLIVLTEGLFLLLALALAVEWVSGRHRIVWRPSYLLLLFYAAAFAPSLLVTPDLRAGARGLATEFFLVALAAATALVIDTEDRLRRAVLTWLAATALVGLVAVASLIAFATGTAQWLLDYSTFHFGTLAPGHYPRLALTFFNANMACNYLIVSLGLALVARLRGWLSSRASWLLLGLIALAAASTISPGLGGIALLIGLWPTFTGTRSVLVRRLALVAGVGTAAAAVVALSVTPILHPTAPFLIHLPGGLILAPSGRFLCWSAAVAEFARHPLIGHGLGVGAVYVRYLHPAGELELLTDAHNMILNVAAQAGLLGIAAIAALTAFAIRLALSSQRSAVPLVLGITFLIAWLYQGLGGSFEDARHLWVLLGLLMAAARLETAPSAAEGLPAARQRPPSDTTPAS